jgi:hypothetical protein
MRRQEIYHRPRGQASESFYGQGRKRN